MGSASLDPARRRRGCSSDDVELEADLIAALDPEVREAIGDVDRSLIQLTLALSPWERLRSASEMAGTLARFRRL